MNTTSLQPLVFMMTIYAGLLSGLVYDFHRLLRKLINKKWATVLFDVFFILFFGSIIAAALYLSSNGEIRLFSLLGIVLGFILYIAVISPLFSFIAQKIKKKRSKKNN